MFRDGHTKQLFILLSILMRSEWYGHSNSVIIKNAFSTVFFCSYSSSLQVTIIPHINILYIHVDQLAMNVSSPHNAPHGHIHMLRLYIIPEYKQKKNLRETSNNVSRCWPSINQYSQLLQRIPHTHWFVYECGSQLKNYSTITSWLFQCMPFVDVSISCYWLPHTVYLTYVHGHRFRAHSNTWRL